MLARLSFIERSLPAQQRFPPAFTVFSPFAALRVGRVAPFASTLVKTVIDQNCHTASPSARSATIGLEIYHRGRVLEKKDAMGGFVWAVCRDTISRQQSTDSLKQTFLALARDVTPFRLGWIISIPNGRKRRQAWVQTRKRSAQKAMDGQKPKQAGARSAKRENKETNSRV